MNESKLRKDQMQKIGLSLVGFIALIYVYFTFFLGPLNRSRAGMERTIDDLQQKLASSKSEMMKATNLEQKAKEATSRFAAFNALSPEGAPIAWFPPRIKLFLSNQHIEHANARLETSSAYKEPELANWMKYTWMIELPQTDFATAAKALAELENSEPLLGVTKIAIKSMADNPEFQQVSLTANTTISKR